MPEYREFQAIVFAGGKGSRMTEITAGQSKCLLPIGNKPMIWYPLQLLEKHGFKDAIVIVSEDSKNDISMALDKLPLKIKLDIVGIQDAEDIGTADSLRIIYEKIHMDFLIIPCDLITDADIRKVLNIYRMHEASVTALMLPVMKVPDDLATPGLKNKQNLETDLIGIDNRTRRLVFLASASDFYETLSISRKLLKKHTCFTIHSKLMDAHLYVMKKWVLDYLVLYENFNSVKSEFLPHVVKRQLSKPKKQQAVDDKNASSIQTNIKDDIFRFADGEYSYVSVRNLSAYTDHNNDMEEAYHGDVLRCYPCILDAKFGLRANTIQMYNYANAKISEWWNTCSDSERISPAATIKTTQIQNCYVDENAFIDEKTSLKQTHVGSGAVIKAKTRIVQSVIMEKVTIEERCVIQNCILCNGCIIQEGSELKDCIVGAQHVVAAGSSCSREVLTEADRLIEI